MVADIKLIKLMAACSGTCSVNSLITAVNIQNYTVKFNCTTSPIVDVELVIDKILTLRAKISLYAMRGKTLFDKPVIDGWQLKILR